MALYTGRIRRAFPLASFLLHNHFRSPKSIPPIHSIASHLPVALDPQNPRTPNFSDSKSFRLFSSSSPVSPSWRSGRSRVDDGPEITEDTILFEGCDYNHWLITVDFPKEEEIPAEEKIATYERIAEQVFGSMEEAKKRIYACSTTVYEGFQVECSEETSEKFKDVPGVVFVLPDSYIDPVNKQYGGDKYDNGHITPRPPPIPVGRESRARRPFQRRLNQGPVAGYENQPQNFGHAGNPLRQQNFGPPGNPPRQQNFGPPGNPPRQQNFGPPGNPSHQPNFGPPQSPPYQQQNFGPPGNPLHQPNFGPPQSPPYQQQNFGPPHQPNFGPPQSPPYQQQNFGPPRSPSSQPNFGPPPQQNFDHPGQENFGPPQCLPFQQNFAPPQNPSFQQNSGLHSDPRSQQKVPLPQNAQPHQNYAPQQNDSPQLNSRSTGMHFPSQQSYGPPGAPEQEPSPAYGHQNYPWHGGDQQSDSNRA